ncbi:MAG TPA: hypothetical protein VE642_03330 [Pyrinomonadaceae bacterium]|jgi:hypothetical protein|nr:hypothetical protein [Pyrinomonadaceae bacterium]
MNVGGLVRWKGFESIGPFRVKGVEADARAVMGDGEITIARLVYLEGAGGAGFLPDELVSEEDYQAAANPWPEVRGEWERFVAEVEGRISREEGGGQL